MSMNLQKRLREKTVLQAELMYPYRFGGVGVGETLNSVTVCETSPQFCLQLKSVVLG